MKKKIYIIGKVTGLNQRHVELKFNLYAQKLRELGFIPINPIEVVNDWKTDWHTAMRKCIAALMTADAVIAHPDSDKSKGAATELRLCSELDIPQFISFDGLLKHFGKYPQHLCQHPKPHFMDIDSCVNCETVKTVCRECSKVLSIEIDCR